MASLDWFYGFRKRHDNLSLRIAENISTGRAEAFNESRITKFYEETMAVVTQLGLAGFPQLLYNCDETGLSSVPNRGKKVLAEKGAKLVQRLQSAERGTLTTLLPCANACGDFIPPFLIFKGQITPDKDKFVTDCKICSTKSGYIDTDVFKNFLIHFQMFRKKVDGKKCILFLDGHGSHCGIEAIEYCIANDIELVCLPPHSSHRIQPLDTHYNKPLKNEWSQQVSKFLANESKVMLTKFEFHKIFNPVWETMLTKGRSLMINAFNHCGLYPVRNPTSKQDFCLSRTFEQCSSNSKIRLTDEGACVRAILPSPKKDANPRHLKGHIAHISSPEHHHEKKINAQSKVSSSAYRRTLCSSSSTRNNLKRQRNEHYCCVCEAQWTEAMGDWFLYRVCNKWACENCFGVETCANC